MNQYFEDIISVMGKPKWFEDHGFPRYCEFSPSEVCNIYAKEVVYFLIACQSCGTLFKVAISSSGYDSKYNPHSFKEHILNKAIGYGDPPNMKCCGAGPTMSSDNVKVLEFWERPHFDWIRNSKYEIDLYDYDGKI